MNSYSELRFKLAQDITSIYSQESTLRAIIITGSVSRDCADKYSDLEINFYWDVLPSEEERRKLIQKCNGEIRNFYPHKKDSLFVMEDFFLNQIKVDVKHALFSDIEQTVLSTSAEAKIDFDIQAFLHAFQYGIPLYGVDILQDLQKSIHYPDQLQENIINKYADFTPTWTREMFLERNDILALQDSLVSNVKKVIVLLFALNKIYHPGIKWINRSINEMSDKPESLFERINIILNNPDKQVSIQELDTLISETLSLIGNNLPYFDSQKAIEHFRRKRVLDSL